MSSAQRLEALRRMVTIAYCRSRHDPEASLWKFAKAIDPSIWCDSNDVWHGLRKWQYYDAGEVGIGLKSLELMENSVPGTIRLHGHPFWDLLGEKTHSRAELIEIVRRLPNAFVDLLLAPPDKRTGHIEIFVLGDYVQFCIESLGTLDAVSALLAASFVYEEEDARQSALDACRSAIRLFLRLALTRPFSEFLPRIWPFIEERFVDRLGLLELKSYQRIQEDYRLLLEIGGKLTVFGLMEEDHLDFLALADRWFFGNIIFLLKQAVPRLDNDKKWRFEQYPKALSTLVVELEELGVHQTNELVKWSPYPKEDFDDFEHAMRQNLPQCSLLEEGAMYEAYDYE